MKVLYIYPKTDELISRHVSLLTEGLSHSEELQTATSLNEFKERLEAMQPDIVHLHGCWNYATNKSAAIALKRGVRLVLSPHGGLEPWGGPSKVSLRDMAYFPQANVFKRAYAIITLGKMEYNYIHQPNMNPRMEIVHNAVITNSLTPQQMCSQTLAVYQKVMDSNVLQLMSDDERRQMAAILKAGITGDARWLSEQQLSIVRSGFARLLAEGRKNSQLSSDTSRRLLIYAEHENIRNYVDYGISILGLSVENLDTQKIAAYFPEKYRRPTPLRQLIGDFKGDETDYLVRMFRQLQKEPQLLHLIELHRELMREAVDDDSLCEALEEKRLTAFARRIMQILSEQTLLDEGYMPLAPLDDRGTRQIRNLIANHLKI